MLTIPIALASDRYQFRFEGSVPMPMRLSDELRSLSEEGVVDLSDEQAIDSQSGRPLWFVRISVRDRETGAVASERIRRAGDTAPHADVPAGAFVRLDGLTLAHSSYNGRISRRWQYAGMAQTDAGQTNYGARELNRFALDPSGLTVEVLSTLPKPAGHEADVRALIASGRIEADAVRRQATDRSGAPLWLVECRFDNSVDVAYENVVVAGDDPKLGNGEPVTLEGLSVSGWSIPGADLVGTSVRADAIHKVRKSGRRDQPVAMPTPEPEHAAVPS